MAFGDKSTTVDVFCKQDETVSPDWCKSKHAKFLGISMNDA